MLILKSDKKLNYSSFSSLVRMDGIAYQGGIVTSRPRGIRNMPNSMSNFTSFQWAREPMLPRYLISIVFQLDMMGQKIAYPNTVLNITDLNDEIKDVSNEHI